MLKGQLRLGRKAPTVLRTFLLRGLLQLDLLVEGRQSLAIVLGVPSQSFKAVGLVFELNQQLLT